MIDSRGLIYVDDEYLNGILAHRSTTTQRVSSYFLYHSYIIPLYFLIYGLLKGIKMIQRMVAFSYILVTKI
jgi:hypothetical protein